MRYLMVHHMANGLADAAHVLIVRSKYFDAELVHQSALNKIKEKGMT